MEIAMDKLALLDSCLDRVIACDYRELMRVTESTELIKMCKLATRASMERKESGRAFYRRSDYPELDPELKKVIVMWKENNEPRFSWGL
jgi:succinate dehydrogenase/fumarate reductase flavoprotein subunit